MPAMSHGGHDNPEQDDDQFERQDLIDMVHEKRGVTPGAEPEQMVPRRPTRITHHEIKAMKVTVRKESSPVVGLFRQIGGLFGGIAEAIGSLFTSRRGKVDPCQVNGHVFPKNWKGEFPRCKHCQAIIRHPEEAKPKSNQ